jgi:soluble lytic murein transglycosylase-like protein
VKLSSAVAAAVVTAANRHGLDPCVLAAVVWKESSGDPNAIRHEPHYRWLWDVWEGKPFRRVTPDEAAQSRAPEDFRGPTGASDATEWAAQRTSWGLCQVMGAVARERGYKGTFLSALCDADLGAEYGARHLALLLRRWELADALSAYNAGSPTATNEPTYVRPVLKMAETYRREGF